MEHRRLGNSGLMVSAVGLGTNNFGGRIDEAQSIRVLDQSLADGIDFIDTANMYTGTQSEQIIGKWLKGKRDKVLVATKWGHRMGEGPNRRGGSRKHIIDSVEASLDRLQTDYVDLYQMHVPDPETSIEETLRALDDLITQGKIRYIGTSNFASWQLCEAEWTSRTLKLNHFISEQPYYNILRREPEQEVVPMCRKYGIGVIPYFPLESGYLTGKYQRDVEPKEGRLAGSPQYKEKAFTERNWAILEHMTSFAGERGRSVTELAIAWLLAEPSVGSVIAGATKPEQVRMNAKAANWHLTPEEKRELDDIANQ